MTRVLTTVKLAADELVYTNCAVVNAKDYDATRVKHIEVKTGTAHRYVLSVKNHPSVASGHIAIGMPQRKWLQLPLEHAVEVQPVQLGADSYAGVITLETDFYNRKSVTTDPLDSDAMAREFGMAFNGQAFTVGMQLVFRFADAKGVSHLLALTVKHMECVDVAAAMTGEQKKQQQKELQCGQLLPNSTVVFDRAEASQLILTGRSKGKAHYRAIINPEWDFAKMGIGGLDNEFSAIFRRAFASRVFPPCFIEQLGMKHVRGILLHGPPGTGKTLMARQIGRMLNAREPKIINGPQILDKYVGESEANIRRLFADAEEEWKRCGMGSGLHIIIFDEIDAICKQRGSAGPASGVHDTVVNQLLSKMDGVEQLNNVLIIGMTNRRDLIDEALLRPGRFEVQMQISLPDENGRVQILKIHTSRMREYGKLAADVDVEELARLTKNFSGAELEGLVRAAQSSAMNRLVKARGKVEIDVDAVEKLVVNRDDFLYALENDVKPAHGCSEEILQRCIGRTGVIPYNEQVKQLLEDGQLLIEQARTANACGLVSVLLEGPPNTGKTALAAQFARESDFPFVRVVSPEGMIGFSESAKCAILRKAFDDAYKSPYSVVLVDNVERLIDYAPIGPRYSNMVLQALLVLLKMTPTNRKCRLLIVCTCSNRTVVDDFELATAFSSVLHVQPLRTGGDVMAVLSELGVFSEMELKQLETKIARLSCEVGIKKLLDIVDLVKQTEEGNRVPKFLYKMEEEGGLEIAHVHP